MDSNIVVQTRRGTPIDNNQSFDVTRYDEVVDLDLRARHRGATFRTGISPIYNCHGLTFGSRRTRIWQAQSVLTILTEDEYADVTIHQVLAGDIIIYTAENGDVEHSGVVVEVKALGSGFARRCGLKNLTRRR
jgi:hypothetical protein